MAAFNLHPGDNISIRYENGVLTISGNYGAATVSAPGLMSAADKAKLDGIVLATASSDGLMSAEDKANLDALVSGGSDGGSDTSALETKLGTVITKHNALCNALYDRYPGETFRDENGSYTLTYRSFVIPTS